MSKYFISICILLVSFQQTSAQHVGSANYWMNIGFGQAQFPSFMAAVAREFKNKPTHALVRYTFNSQIHLFGPPRLSMQEFGILYGVKARDFRFSAGISRVWGTNRQDFFYQPTNPPGAGFYTERPAYYSTFGLPGEIRYIKSTRSVGIGITIFGNLNTQRSFGGANVSFYLGKMK